MKYIMMKRKIGDVEQLVPIIFPNFIVHKHMAQAIKNLPGNPYNLDNVVHSAGDVIFDSCSVHTSGGSETLNIESKEGDNNIIELHDYFQGIVND